MRTLLLNLPKNLDNRFDFDQVAQPLGLACISSYMQHKGLDVTLFDAHAFHLNRKKVISYVLARRPDLLGISVMTYQLPVILSFLADIKPLLPNMLVVLGGPHVNAEPDNTLRTIPQADFVVIGEGEMTMVELVTTIQDKKDLTRIRGLAFQSGDEITINQRRPYISDISTLPYPDWDALPMERYWDVFTTRRNYARIFASRGCPFRCTFCGASKILGSVVRKRTPDHILGEIAMLHDKYGVREILFNDSTFNIDNDWVEQICEGLLRLERQIIWRCNVRADRVRKQTIRLMKKSGCVKVIMGVESADEAMLQSMCKGETLEQIKEAINILKAENMPSDHGFIIGMPGDTSLTIRRSIAFAKEIDASVVTFSLATPLPGTAFYEQARLEGMEVKDWSQFDFFGVPYVPTGMTKEELQSLYRKAVREFYLRPRYLLRRIGEMRSLTNLRINLWYAFRILLRFIANRKRERRTKATATT